MAKKTSMRDRAKAHRAEAEDQDDDAGRSGGDELSDDERALLRGGPGAPDVDEGDETSSTDQEAETVEVMIGGKKRTIDKELADALEAERGERIDPDEFRRVKAQLEELKTGKARPQAAQGDEVDEDAALAEEIFTDPKSAIKKIRAQAVREATSRVTDAYVADQAEKEFWTGFYDKYKELADVDWLVKQVLKENEKSFIGLSVAKGAEKLAKLSETKLQTLVKKVAPGPTKKPNTRSSVEGSDEAPRRQQPIEGRRPAADTSGKVISLTDILRKRKLERRAAANKRLSSRR